MIKVILNLFQMSIQIWIILKQSLGLPRWLSAKESACSAGDVGSIPGSGRPLEKEMVAYSNILAWRIPWTEEPGGLQSVGSQESDMT